MSSVVAIDRAFRTPRSSEKDALVPERHRRPPITFLDQPQSQAVTVEVDSAIDVLHVNAYSDRCHSSPILTVTLLGLRVVPNSSCSTPEETKRSPWQQRLKAGGLGGYGERRKRRLARLGGATIGIMQVSRLAGKPAPPSLLVNVSRLVTAYYAEQPDPSIAAQRVAFGTSGHRGSALSLPSMRRTSWPSPRQFACIASSNGSRVRSSWGWTLMRFRSRLLSALLRC